MAGSSGPVGVTRAAPPMPIGRPAGAEEDEEAAPHSAASATSAVSSAAAEAELANNSNEVPVGPSNSAGRSGLQSASHLIGAPRTGGATREELMERGFSANQVDAQLVRQHEEEIMQIHFQRLVVCFSVTFLLVVITALALQLWVFAAYTEADPAECDVPLRTWVVVLFCLWGFRIFRSCVDRCICCWSPHEDNPTPPLRVRVKDYLVLCFDFVWSVCLGFYWLGKDGSGSGEFPPCKVTAPTLHLAAKVYICFHVASTIWLWISVIGLRNMLRHLMRNGYLHTSAAAPPDAIEKNTDVVTMTREEMEENQSCPICMEDFGAGGEEVAKTKACDHFFHKSCLKNWLKTARSCPLCRQDLATNAAEAVKPSAAG